MCCLGGGWGGESYSSLLRYISASEPREGFSSSSSCSTFMGGGVCEGVGTWRKVWGSGQASRGLSNIMGVGELGRFFPIGLPISKGIGVGKVGCTREGVGESGQAKHSYPC